MAKLAILSPWFTLYGKMEAMFANDPEVRVVYEEKEEPHERKINLFVDNEQKCAALDALIEHEHTFGNVTVKVECIPANAHEKLATPLMSVQELWETALKGNGALSFVQNINCPLGVMNYVVFRKEVVQFFNDDLGDIYGNCSTLYQDIAKELFSHDCPVYFCTEADDAANALNVVRWP